MVTILSTEDKILKVALKLFSKYGYSGISTKEIARNADVNEVTIFRKFKSKSNLFQQVITHYAKDGNVLKNLEEDLTGDLRRDLFIFGISFYKFLLNNELMYKLQVKQVDEKTMKFTNSLEYTRYFTRYLNIKKEEGRFLGDPQSTSILFISTIMGLFTFRVFTEELLENIKIEKLIEEEISMLISMYLPKES